MPAVAAASASSSVSRSIFATVGLQSALLGFAAGNLGYALLKLTIPVTRHLDPPSGVPANGPLYSTNAKPTRHDRTRRPLSTPLRNGRSCPRRHSLSEPSASGRRRNTEGAPAPVRASTPGHPSSADRVGLRGFCVPWLPARESRASEEGGDEHFGERVRRVTAARATRRRTPSGSFLRFVKCRGAGSERW
jgi:hypothetical protein